MASIIALPVLHGCGVALPAPEGESGRHLTVTGPVMLEVLPGSGGIDATAGGSGPVEIRTGSGSMTIR